MTWVKRIVVLFTLFIVLIGGGFALISSQNVRQERPIIRYQVDIQHPDNQQFLIEDDLQKILQSAGAPWDSVARVEINIPLLEENLRKHPLVLGAEVFSTWEGVLHVEIVQKQAKARMSNELEMIYVDNQGATFPLSAHASAVLPLLQAIWTLLQGWNRFFFWTRHVNIQPFRADGLHCTETTKAPTQPTLHGMHIRSTGGMQQILK